MVNNLCVIFGNQFSNTMANEMIYNDYIIEKEIDPWPLHFGMKYRFYLTDGEVIHHAPTVEDAKISIDEGDLKNSYDPNPDAWSGVFSDNH